MNKVPPVENFSFSGFAPSYHYTNTPDIAFDLFPHLLTGTEIKVLDYLFRRSSLQDFDVSIKQMLHGLVTKDGRRLDYGCGVKSHHTVIKAVRKLRELGLITITHRVGSDKRHLANEYRIKYDASSLYAPTLLQQYIERNEIPSAENINFDGFPFPMFTPIPDEIYDIFLHVLSNRAYLVMRYVCRHTFGWKKKMDDISLAQMVNGIVTKDGKRIDYGCGIKNRGSIIKGIREAEQAGVLVVRRNTKANGANATTTYGLKFRADPPINPSIAAIVDPVQKVDPTPNLDKVLPLGKTVTPPSAERLPPLGRTVTPLRQNGYPQYYR